MNMDNNHDYRYFDALDYSVFTGMLVLSALIGVYFAFFAKQKQNTTSEYLLGGKSMGVFPISMSLIASYISGIAILGFPSEMYTYGTQLWMSIVPETFTSITVAFIYLPVFYTLQVTSSYEYLRKRFNKTVRTLGSALFLLKMLLYIPIVIYVPALALAQVTGFSLNMIIPTVCLVCTFYTTLGGLKAVVWTDTLQMGLMILGVMTVLFLGTNDVGGFKTVWDRNLEGDRIEFFNMNPDPRIRHTFWNVFIGKFTSHLASCTVNQMMVQRCLAMPSQSKARIVLWIFTFGIVGSISVCCYTGLVIYAAFYNCDPITTKTISKADQLLPYFVMKITSHVPALPGIFVAGVFSAALSTMSTGLNSMTGVILVDFIRPLCKKPLSEGRASLYMKTMVAILGTIFVALAFAVDQLGGLIQTSQSLAGITAGTLLGIFTLGMVFPWANSIGAIVGGFTSSALIGWISIGTQLAVKNKQIILPKKPTSIEGCGNYTLSQYYEYMNNTTPVAISDPGEPFPLYTMSYTFYPVIGGLTVIVVGLIVSFMTGPNNPNHMDPDLFPPLIQRFLKTEHDVVSEMKLMKKRESIEIFKRASRKNRRGNHLAADTILENKLFQKESA